MREQNRLDRLHSELDRSSDHLRALCIELEMTPVDVPTPLPSSTPVDGNSSPSSNSEKVSIFRSLFRGREDVFPRRWENPRNGKAGYSPACGNDWKTGICEKIGARREVRRPGTICGNCGHQAFLPVTDAEIARHLTGVHVMGVYPLLRDETCWFLAADFDEKSWDEDVVAFAKTCQVYNVPVLIERSRSGNGAHAWIFFASPVQASVARAMGCFLITETMARRHQLSMESYDRLFPNQDTLPKGGFGNLIALPLQRKAREQGNSVFVDSSLTQFPDQWASLKGFVRIEPAFVRAIADDATSLGKIFVLRTDSPVTSEGQHPKDRAHLGPNATIEAAETLPPSVNAVFSRRLSIEGSC